MSALGVINQAPQTAMAAFGQQANEDQATEQTQENRNYQLYNGYQGVQGSAEQIQNSEGAQGNLYSGGAQMAEQANKQSYTYANTGLKQQLRGTLANLALNRFLNASGQSGA